MPVILVVSQLVKSPARQAGQVLSWPPCQPTPARSPFRQAETPEPTSSMTPAISCPGMRGYCSPGHKPSLLKTSLWQTPQASTLMRTCPGPGRGISRSTNSKSPLALETCATLIFVICAFSCQLGSWPLDAEKNCLATICARPQRICGTRSERHGFGASAKDSDNHGPA